MTKPWKLVGNTWIITDIAFNPLEKQEADFYLSCQWSQVFICTNNAHVNYKQKNIQSIFFTHNVKHEIGQCEFCTILT